MIDVFLSYRRADTRADAGRLYDRLVDAFGDARVFMDVDDIEPGENFVRVLERTLDRCNVLLVLIGPRWLEDGGATGRRRIDDEGDFVRMEIERALARGIRIIPVLVGGAEMPSASAVPASIASFTEQQAYVIQDGRFHPDVDRLIQSIDDSSRAPFGILRLLRRHRAASVLVLLLLLAVAIVAVVLPLAEQRRTDRLVSQHLEVAKRFADDARFDSAIGELEQALALDPERVSVHRRLVELNERRLTLAAFGSARSAAHIGLSDNYRRQRPVPEAELDATLGRLYSLLALAPELEKDVDLLLTKARILKTSGARVDDAIETLERAHALSPKRADVLGELGLLLSVTREDPRGVALLREARTIAPDSALGQFYLARGLSTVHHCKRPREPFDGSRCAEAIRSFHRAATRSDGADLWSRQVHHVSIRGALEIFRRVAREPRDILAPALDMPLEERLSLLRYLAARTRDMSSSGPHDDRGYWLARLHEALGEPARAEELMRKRIEELGRPPPELWRELLERVSRPG